MKRKTADDYHALAALNGFEWIGESDFPANTGVPTIWKCPEGHIWHGNYDNIKQGHGCLTCGFERSGNARRRKPEDYHALAEAFGLEWLSHNPPHNNKVPTLWRCPNGHDFELNFNNVQRGHGCPVCAGVVTKTIDDYRTLGLKHGLEFRDLEAPSNNKGVCSWCCAKGHVFLSSYNSVARDHGCPYCLDFVNGVLVSRQQRAIHRMVGGELNFSVGRYRIDIAVTINNTPIAIEYDGWRWHNAKDETSRDAMLISRGWHILHIRSSHQIPTQDQIDAAIQRLVEGVMYGEIILSDWGKRLRRQESY